jgi:small subunit ribosomal protein S7
MPRRQSIARKTKYQAESHRVTDRFRAKLMRDGKQTLSDRILRQALARAEFQAKRPGLEVLEAALRNATPIIEVKPRRVGGATYQVPVEIRGDRRLSLGVRWLVQAARKRNGKREARRGVRRCHERPRRGGEATRGHPQDGRGQQGLQPLQVVVRAQRS